MAYARIVSWNLRRRAMANWFKTHVNQYVNLDNADKVWFGGFTAIVTFQSGDYVTVEGEETVDRLHARLDAAANPARGK
jgi:hypothetical protein